MQFSLPKQAEVNKFIPKSKFFTKASITTKTKQLFTDSIHKITWRYKLSADTINIVGTENIEEIQIFEIELKDRIISKQVLSVIDKSIPYPILYVFRYKSDYAYGITLKDSGLQRYYFSEWNQDIAFDFVALDLEQVYQKIIRAFIQGEPGSTADFATVVSIDIQRQQLAREIQVLKSKISAEKQFKLQVQLHQQVTEKQKQLDSLSVQL